MGIFSKKKGRLVQKWEYNTNSTLLSGPMVFDIDKDGRNEIVCGTKDGRVLLMDQESNIKWSYNVSESVDAVDSFFQDAERANSIIAPPTIGDINQDGLNEVVFGTESGTIYALDSNGMILWRHHAPGAIKGSVLLHDINDDSLLEVIVGCMNGDVLVLSSTGQVLWKFNLGKSIGSTPAIIPNSKKIIIGCDDGSIKCLKFKGEVEWNFTTAERVVAAPIITSLFKDSGNMIIIGSSDYHMYVLKENGELFWKFKTEGSILSKAAVADINNDGKKEIVFGSCDNNVYALTHDGDKIWSYETYFWVVAPPIIDDIDSDGKLEVIVGSYDNNVYILDSEGIYSLDYVPGLGGVVNQTGHYTELMTRQPGKIEAKMIWQYKTKGFVVGCSMDKDVKSLIVNVKEGFVSDLIHSK